MFASEIKLKVSQSVILRQEESVGEQFAFSELVRVKRRRRSRSREERSPAVCYFINHLFSGPAFGNARSERNGTPHKLESQRGKNCRQQSDETDDDDDDDDCNDDVIKLFYCCFIQHKLKLKQWEQFTISLCVFESVLVV